METTDQAVLLVDDEAQILSALKRLLRKEPYRLFVAESGAEALGILRENPVQMIITDQRMPHMTGTEFLEQAKEICPDAIRVMLSGYAEPEAILGSINRGEVFRFIAKPWNDEDLKTTVRQCLEHWTIRQENQRLNEEAERHVKELERLNALLRNSVEERTMSLQFSQEMLEHLPLPVLGISAEEEVILSNDAARDRFAELRHVIPGTALEDVLPDDVVEAIRSSVTRTACDEFTLAWDGAPLRARPRRLGPDNEPRGYVLVLEDEAP